MSELTQDAIKLLTNEQTSKALATNGSQGLNVVPVSTIRIDEGKIWLIDYFFGKTKDNVVENSKVSLVGWNGFDGYQVKADAQYLTQGAEFEKAKAWIGQILPSRVVKALVLLTPDEVHSVSIANKV